MLYLPFWYIPTYVMTEVVIVNMNAAVAVTHNMYVGNNITCRYVT